MLRSLLEVRRQPAVLLFAAALLALGSPLGRPAIAQSDNRAAGTTAPDAVTPVEEFSKQVEEFKKSYPELNKKIEDSAKSIDAITDSRRCRCRHPPSPSSFSIPRGSTRCGRAKPC